MKTDNVWLDFHRLSDSRRVEIELFLKQAKHTHFYQQPDWGVSLQGYKSPKILLSYQANRLVAYSLIRVHHVKLINKYKYYIQRGPVFNDVAGLQQHLSALKQSLNNKQGLWLTLSPYLYEGSPYVRVFEQEGFYPDWRNNFSYQTTLTVDLNDSLDSIKAGFRRSLKTQLNKAERLEIDFKQCDSYREFESFVEFFNRFRVRKSLMVLPIRDAQSIYARLINDEKNCLLLAKMGREILASIGLFGAGTSVVYEWGCSSDEEAYRKLPLSHLLHWRGIQWAKQMGYRYYDFGGYWEDLGENNSINRFKLGFTKHVQAMMQPQIYNFAPKFTRITDMAAQTKRWLGC